MGVRTLIVAVIALVAALLPGVAQAAPPTADFDFSQYRSVNADAYRSLAYSDNGRHYFTTGRWSCQIGPQANAAACKGRPATAPPGVIGVAFAGESQGPYWVRPGSSFRLGPVSGFRAPVLPIGSRITVVNVTCAVPRAGVVACRNWNRGFQLSRGTHRFLYPAGDTAHDGNPKR
ncbi:hypothetical protein SCNU_12963 [Gordonia neofelifaecis NRRL B-59395]|uniref:Uncharacterized protein n=1 Tax=Gordonia neofelifaecis NRRL B-59395 TaxID=644548 RepID=F1YL35_9ACTN|nr:hypothetical protein SCNU_12963 [Gordonia neofelifaecis NRRL B-59395]